MSKKIAAGAILMCAVMVLILGAPLVTADTHHIVKGAQGPRASAVSWTVVPAENGGWHGVITNSGLRWLVVDVDDVTSGSPVSILHQRIRFAAYPTNVVETENAVMTSGRTYTVTATPNGPRETYCDIEDVFVQLSEPFAAFTWTVDGQTVSVDGSGSWDTDGQIVAWGWDWGDGSTGTGVTATHTYAIGGDKTVTLTVMDNDGLTGSVAYVIPIVFIPPPNAVFTGVTATGGVLNVDASASTAVAGIASYDWNFGDHIIASGVTRTHTYMVSGTFTVTLTVTDTLGQMTSVTQTFTVVNTALPPLPYTVFGYVTQSATPVVGAMMGVNNVRTGETLIDVVSDATGLYYVDNIMPLYFVSGDTMIVSATAGAATGSTTVVLDLTGTPYVEVDVAIA